VALKESMKEGMTAEKTEAEKQRRGEILEKLQPSQDGDSEAMINYEKEIY
jgi:hypothetical protein